jgi:hypothetical protein
MAAMHADGKTTTQQPQVVKDKGQSLTMTLPGFVQGKQ